MGVPGVPRGAPAVVGRCLLPVDVAPVPVVVAQGPVTAYYGSPAPFTTYYNAAAVYVGPRGNVRAAYYAPAPAAYYYAPGTATFYDRGFPRTVILP